MGNQLKHPTGYCCKECGKPASVATDGTIQRTCDHTGTIYLLLDVVVTGEGGAGATFYTKWTQFLHAMGLKFMELLAGMKKKKP